MVERKLAGRLGGLVWKEKHGGYSGHGHSGHGSHGGYGEHASEGGGYEDEGWFDE